MAEEEQKKEKAGPESDIDPAKVDYDMTARGAVKEGPVTSLTGGDVARVEQYPTDYTQLELMQWDNYSLRSDEQLPFPFASSVDQNRRIWDDNYVEGQLDNQPPHEIHPKDLPDYHYWPMIQNEVQARAGRVTPGIEPYRQDQTDLPRFYRTGMPKTPFQQQGWFVPLTAEGRFDWRANLAKNGYSRSAFDAKGWDRRFKWSINRPNMWFFGSYITRPFMSNVPTFFKSTQVSARTRMFRNTSGNRLNFVMMYLGLYGGLLISTGYGDAHYKRMMFDLEPWNYDITFMQNLRDKGGFHGLV